MCWVEVCRLRRPAVTVVGNFTWMDRVTCADQPRYGAVSSVVQLRGEANKEGRTSLGGARIAHCHDHAEPEAVQGDRPSFHRALRSNLSSPSPCIPPASSVFGIPCPRQYRTQERGTQPEVSKHNATILTIDC